MSARNLALAAVVGLAACSGGDTATNDERARPTPTTVETLVTKPEFGGMSSPTTSPVQEPPSTSPSSVATTVSTSPSEETGAAVLAARVRGLLDARAQANAGPTPNPEDLNLAVWATGAALDELRAEATQRRGSGEAMRPAVPSQAAVRVGFVVQNGTAATVSVCRVDDDVVFEVASGRVLNDTIATQHLQFDFVLTDGALKVSAITRLQRWEGVAGCALAEADFPY